MNKLLTRGDFRGAVFERDKCKCVVCGKPANDAHHILDRKLFEDGGYYIDNGVSLCHRCHVLAEDITLTPDELRRRAGITNVVLPHDFDPEVTYDKWGNEVAAFNMMYPGPMFRSVPVQNLINQGAYYKEFNVKYTKYPRTPHLPWSEKATDDDKRLKNVDHFEGRDVVVSIKMDGENTTMYDDKIHARSINSDNHPSRDWVKGLWANTGYQIPQDWRICGENLYALHTIPYENLESYFNVFSIWDKDYCMSWDETVEWATLFGLITVPVFYRGVYNQEEIHKAFPEEYKGNKTEGYVIRLAGGYYFDDFETSIAKFVSSRFVINSDKHWMQGKVTPNKLIDNGTGL